MALAVPRLFENTVDHAVSFIDMRSCSKTACGRGPYAADTSPIQR